jgi:hypothetical protein
MSGQMHDLAAFHLMHQGGKGVLGFGDGNFLHGNVGNG